MPESGLSPSTVVAIYGVLRRIMRTAEIDGLIHRTPCLGVSLPKETSHQEMHFLDHAEVARLAAAIDERYRSLIFTAAYTGLRGASWPACGSTGSTSCGGRSTSWRR